MLWFLLWIAWTILLFQVADLKARGVITEAEFEQQKAKVLA